MDTQDRYEQLNTLLLKSPGLQQLLNYVQLDAQFEIRVGKAFALTLKKSDQTWRLENSAAQKPYGIISFSPEGLETVLKSNFPSVEETLSIFFKLYLAGLVKIEFKESVRNLVSMTSLELLQATSEKLHQVLKTFGLENWSRKIPRL